jgi:hypothetical protein
MPDRAERYQPVRTIDFSKDEAGPASAVFFLISQAALFVATCRGGFTRTIPCWMLEGLCREAERPVIDPSAPKIEEPGFNPRWKRPINSNSWSGSLRATLIRAAYQLLGLQTCFTAGVKCAPGPFMSATRGLKRRDPHRFRKGLSALRPLRFDDFISLRNKTKDRQMRAEGRIRAVRMAT